MTTNVIVYGDTFRVPELRHELPLGVPDPFLYVETGGSRHVVVGSMEVPRIVEAAPRVEVHPLERFGYDELIAAGATKEAIRDETAVRALRRLGVGAAAVPFAFPTGWPSGCARRASSCASTRSSSTSAAASRPRRSWPGSGARSGRPRRAWTRRGRSCAATGRSPSSR